MAQRIGRNSRTPRRKREEEGLGETEADSDDGEGQQKERMIKKMKEKLEKGETKRKEQKEQIEKLKKENADKDAEIGGLTEKARAADNTNVLITETRGTSVEEKEQLMANQQQKYEEHFGKMTRRANEKSKGTNDMRQQFEKQVEELKSK